MAAKITVAVIFGGRSGEHEVSLRSAQSIINALDKDKYNVIPIGITQAGNWLTSRNATNLLPESVLAETTDTDEVALIGSPSAQGLINLNRTQAKEGVKIDVIFPALHGTYGEDGTIQGLLEMADIPYVGCGVLASSVGMDKVAMKQIFVANGLPVGPFTSVLRNSWERDRAQILPKIAAEIGFPAFVKPANLGSSVGISKAKDIDQLAAAIDLAAQYDRKIIIEKGINAREFEISILGNDEPIASLPGEVIPGAEFYDYNDKYLDNKTQFEIPAKLSAEQLAQIQEIGVRAFQAIDGAGLARVDLFLDRDTNQWFLNEINTLPGFTSISMYPKLWQASGITYPELIDRLIALAIARHQEKSRNITTYQPS